MYNIKLKKKKTKGKYINLFKLYLTTERLRQIVVDSSI